MLELLDIYLTAVHVSLCIVLTSLYLIKAFATYLSLTFNLHNVKMAFIKYSVISVLFGVQRNTGLNDRKKSIKTF